MLRRLIFALLFAVTLVAPRTGEAHPHVWVSAMVNFVFEEGKLVALRQAWVFDDFFSSTLINDFDKDKNGTFDEAEQRDLAARAFANLRDYDYFSRVRQGVQSFPLNDAESFSATQAKGLVFYGFTVRLAEPLDPAAAPVTAGIYDASFFVDFALDANDPVRFDGMPSGACSYAIREDPADAIYGGLVVPPSVTITCKAT